MSYQRGDVVWGPDPFKSGETPRPWLILNNDRHPFGDEENMTVTLTTTSHDEGIPLDGADWVKGGMPRQSYASPWVVASPKHAAIVRRQGRLSESFVQTVVDALGTYLEPLGPGAVHLADQLNIDFPAREELVASFTSGYPPLNPTRPDTGSTDSTYRLRINIESATLAPTES